MIFKYMQVTLFSVNDFEEANLNNEIGCGSFGTVHKLKSNKDNLDYAAKIIRDYNQDEFLSEIEVISKLCHPTLVRFHGIV